MSPLAYPKNLAPLSLALRSAAAIMSANTGQPFALSFSASLQPQITGQTRASQHGEPTNSMEFTTGGAFIVQTTTEISMVAAGTRAIDGTDGAAPGALGIRPTMTFMPPTDLLEALAASEATTAGQ